MRKIITLFSLLLAVLAFSIEAVAQVAKPTFIHQKYKDYGIASALSDNGKWALIVGATNEQKAQGPARLLNVETKEVIVIRDSEEDDDDAKGEYFVSDITDDGNIVVGGFDGSFTSDGYYTGKPGYWTRADMTWHELPIPDGAAVATVGSVTPDGHYAIGSSETDVEDFYNSVSEGIMWDLTTGQIVSLTGKPVMEMDKTESGTAYAQQEAFNQISADGRYIAIYGNQSYTPIAYLYDREKGTYIKFGVDGTNAPSDFNMMEGGITISPNGKWAAGTIRNTNDELFPLLYNIESGTYTAYCNSTAESDLCVDCIDDEGHIYASTPYANPMRDWQVYVDGIWYPFSKIMSQVYGLTYADFSGYDNTGTLYGVSADGRVFASMVSPQGESYVGVMPEALTASCDKIDLLSDFTADPAEGAEYAWVSTVKLTFENEIQALGGKTSAILKDKDGKQVRKSITFAPEASTLSTVSRTLEITFRETKMNAGEDYTIEIPAGTIALASNSKKTNGVITIHYRGRADEPVKIDSIFPTNGSEIARIDATSNPVYLYMDTKVKLTDNASAKLVQVDGDTEKTICSMNVVVSTVDQSYVAIVPSSTQYLYADGQYKVVLAAGSLTDLSGSTDTYNEEYTINYTGTYERQISTDDANLFFDNFSSVSNSLQKWMRYEGDHLTPTSDMQDWTFDADNQPWNFTIRDNSSSSKYYAASHSMYNPAGQSDDWMIIPQLTIPDAYCTLSFKAQSYLESKHDTLRVVIWPHDENISFFGSGRIEDMKKEADVYTYELNIGETEEGLEQEFTDYKIDLAKYAGQKVYIGFWNNNTDQSAIFVDSVLVRRNLKYLMSFGMASSVVNKTETSVKGTLTINSDDDTYSTVTLTLNDADGNVVDTYTQTGLALKKNDKLAFAFSKGLPLTIGETNKYTIGVKLDDYTDAVKGSIKDLAFEPEKRVVLEEKTGFTCQYCPLGLLAMEHIKSLYGDKFIPVCIHTYDGDSYGTGLSSYTTYLGLSTAPSAKIQRGSAISSPMYQNDEGDYVFSYNGVLWTDRVATEFDKPADLAVEVPSITYDESTNKLNVNLQLTAALNLKNQYINVFAVALEDDIVATQSNGLYGNDDPVLGDWGKGGKYGYKEVQSISENDVVRSYWGDSFTGSSVGFPQAFEAGKNYTASFSLTYPDQIYEKEKGKIVFMVFDGNTASLINAVRVKLTDAKTTGINDTQATDASINISAADGKIVVRGAGATDVKVYSVAGTLIAKASGNGAVSVAIGRYCGPVVVKATSGATSITKKLVVE